jgi:outer membrane protein TolC
MMRVTGAALVVLLRIHGGVAGQSAVSQDTLILTLPEAMARAARGSEEVRLARSQVDLADAQVRGVRSSALPQVHGGFSFTRTFESQFNTGGIQIPDSLRFEPDSLGSVADRLRYLEDRAPTAGLAGLGSLFGDLPFGRENAYSASISGSQLLYSGGRTGAALEVARRFREAVELNLSEEVADLELSVQRAYHRALLAAELERISVAALEQAEKFLAHERLRHRSGSAAELDVLRAEVAAANLRPQLIQARNASELALLDLRRLVNIPAEQPLKLNTPLAAPSAEQLQEPVLEGPQLLKNRPAIGAAERQVRMRELGVRIARGSYLPSASLRVNYGRFLYPTSAFGWSGNEWRGDWTAALSVDIPIFDGLRRESQIDEAQVQLRRAQLQLAQLKEGVHLQYEQALGERRRAAADIAARQQTVTQAQRVHDLTVLRYERGLATQLEVSDARLSLLQARTNLAQALSDFHIADATLHRTLGTRITTGDRE